MRIAQPHERAVANERASDRQPQTDQEAGEGLDAAVAIWVFGVGRAWRRSQAEQHETGGEHIAADSKPSATTAVECPWIPE